MNLFKKRKKTFTQPKLQSFIRRPVDPREHSDNQNDEYAWNRAAFEQIYPELKKVTLDERHKIIDVICLKDVSDHRFNTNVTAYIGDMNEMTWGYNGSGPYNLALNILYYFTDGDKDFAAKFVFEFRDDIVSKLPNQDNCCIYYNVIMDWISSRKESCRV
jgi:hypothetical protein